MKKTMLLFGTFLAFEFYSLIVPLLAIAEGEAGMSKLLDPLYIASSIATIMFGLVCWSLGRNLHDIDDKLRDLKVKIEALDSRQDAHCLGFKELLTEHNVICKKGGHK